MTTYRILLVDVSNGILERGKRLFRDDVYQVFTAHAGQDAIRQAMTDRPDLVILDEEMPDLSGHEIVSRIRNVPGLRSVPVILIVGSGEERLLEQHMKLGLSDFVRKPLNESELMRKAAKALGLSERKVVSFLVRVGDGTAGSFARAADLSTSGIRIESHEKLEAGDEVTLQFFVPGSRTRLKLRARVARRVVPDTPGIETGYGLQFLDLSPEQAEQIERSMKGRQ